MATTIEPSQPFLYRLLALFLNTCTLYTNGKHEQFFNFHLFFLFKIATVKYILSILDILRKNRSISSQKSTFCETSLKFILYKFAKIRLYVEST